MAFCSQPVVWMHFIDSKMMRYFDYMYLHSLCTGCGTRILQSSLSFLRWSSKLAEGTDDWQQIKCAQDESQQKTLICKNNIESILHILLIILNYYTNRFARPQGLRLRQLVPQFRRLPPAFPGCGFVLNLLRFGRTKKCVCILRWTFHKHFQRHCSFQGANWSEFIENRYAERKKWHINSRNGPWMSHFRATKSNWVVAFAAGSHSFYIHFIYLPTYSFI